MSKHLRAQAESNLSVAAYCAAHDLKIATFYYWRKKLTAPVAEEPESAGFTELKPAAELQRSTLRLPSGLCIELSGMSTAQLVDLILTLEGRYA